MDMKLSESQEMLKKTARDFLSQECPKSLVREMAAEERGYSDELWNKMVKLGWMGLPFSEKYGGGGGSFLDLVILLDEMGRVCLPGPYFSTIVLGGLNVMELGSDSQKGEIIPSICQGKLFLTLALSEPGVDYATDALSTRAERAGDDYLIKGTKLFVPDAHLANLILCVARVDGKFAVFIVDAKSPKVTLTPLHTMVGDKQFEVVFDEVKVPQSRMLAMDRDDRLIDGIIQRAAIAKCAEMVGGAQQVLEMTVSHASQRVQFGQHIGSFQAIQHFCANMVTDIDISRLLTYQAAWRLSQGLSCSREIAIAKAWISEAFRRVTAMGHQIIAGVGFMEDHDMPLYYRRAKAWELSFGDANFHREKVAQMLGM